ncbi:hypothetical protein BVRB_2g045630 [Beta vulgaris subsp. vulgaris]|uniref:Uncharacterized protein n=1 Tax=Beta vulgaris subsp. vulgaris TaxID=3555 RepID=A0A0J8BDB2_BETVV|nr:hypothetical protein BVRB_2g045630 [Beta vulgaris subsp. vulgaris]
MIKSLITIPEISAVNFLPSNINSFSRLPEQLSSTMTVIHTTTMPGTNMAKVRATRTAPKNTHTWRIPVEGDMMIALCQLKIE